MNLLALWPSSPLFPWDPGILTHTHAVRAIPSLEGNYSLRLQTTQHYPINFQLQWPSQTPSSSFKSQQAGGFLFEIWLSKVNWALSSRLLFVLLQCLQTAVSYILSTFHFALGFCSYWKWKCYLLTFEPVIKHLFENWTIKTQQANKIEH